MREVEEAREQGGCPSREKEEETERVNHLALRVPQIPSLDCCNKRSKYPKSDPPRRNTGEGSRREAWQKCNIEEKSKREADRQTRRLGLFLFYASCGRKRPYRPPATTTTTTTTTNIGEEEKETDRGETSLQQETILPCSGTKTDKHDDDATIAFEVLGIITIGNIVIRYNILGTCVTVFPTKDRRVYLEKRGRQVNVDEATKITKTTTTTTTTTKTTYKRAGWLAGWMVGWLAGWLVGEPPKERSNARSGSGSGDLPLFPCLSCSSWQPPRPLRRVPVIPAATGVGARSLVRWFQRRHEEAHAAATGWLSRSTAGPDRPASSKSGGVAPCVRCVRNNVKVDGVSRVFVYV
ncbi:hypothetical protein V1478_009933 [Vespula squamosa]|uniref:Uncharacterized protein n=1 Tax=Vespula squamosa TaxID=30214 RepID=A0ABD2AJU2_VESSQ